MSFEISVQDHAGIERTAADHHRQAIHRGVTHRTGRTCREEGHTHVDDTECMHHVERVPNDVDPFFQVRRDDIDRRVGGRMDPGLRAGPNRHDQVLLGASTVPVSELPDVRLPSESAESAYSGGSVADTPHT
jgi:hypothetical protein